MSRDWAQACARCYDSTLFSYLDKTHVNFALVIGLNTVRQHRQCLVTFPNTSGRLFPAWVPTNPTLTVESVAGPELSQTYFGRAHFVPVTVRLSLCGVQVTCLTLTRRFVEIASIGKSRNATWLACGLNSQRVLSSEGVPFNP